MRNVRARLTCVGNPKVIRTIVRDASLRASLKDLMPEDNLQKMFPLRSNVELSFPGSGEVHVCAVGKVDATFGASKMVPGETHVLHKGETQTLAVGHEVLKLHGVPSHF